MRLTSKHVRIGAMVGLLVATLACSEGEEEYETVNTAYGEICVRREPPPAVDQSFMADEPELERVPWEQCENDPNHIHYYPYYINHGAGHSAPPVGSRFKASHGASAAPAGSTTARPPASGGFGTRTSVIGG
jgi:hypothetical protein